MKRSTILTIGLLIMLVLAACRSDAGPVRTSSTTIPAPASTVDSTATTIDLDPGASVPSADTSSADVTVRMFQFTPTEFTIKAGESVTWINADRIDHTVTSGTPENPASDFDVTLPDVGSTASVSFEEPGMYDYFCGIHPHMRATVLVESTS